MFVVFCLFRDFCWIAAHLHYSSPFFVGDGSQPWRNRPKNVRMNQLGWPLNNAKGFSKISKPTGLEGTYHLQFDFLQLFSPVERLETDWEIYQMVKKFPSFRFARKKRTTVDNELLASEIQKQLGVIDFVSEIKRVENYPDFEKFAHVIQHGVQEFIVKIIEGESTEANYLSHILYRWVGCMKKF